MKLKSFTIEKEDGTLEIVEVDMDNVEYSVENGFTTHYDLFVSNGMQRIVIKAGKNCTYDTFQKDT